MKKSYLVTIGCVVIAAGLYTWFSYIDISQSSALAKAMVCCLPPHQGGLGNPARWQKDNIVKIRIHNAFTPTEKQIIISAFAEWNNYSYLNCSNVKFDTVKVNPIVETENSLF